jgi:hypothetical protein
VRGVPLSEVLWVRDIARERHLGARTVRRWLLASDKLVRSRGRGSIIRRVGGPRGKIWTTRALLRLADEAWLERRDDDEERLANLEEKVRHLEILWREEKKRRMASDRRIAALEARGHQRSSADTRAASL